MGSGDKISQLELTWGTPGNFSKPPDSLLLILLPHSSTVAITRSLLYPSLPASSQCRHFAASSYQSRGSTPRRLADGRAERYLPSCHDEDQHLAARRRLPCRLDCAPPPAHSQTLAVGLCYRTNTPQGVVSPRQQPPPLLLERVGRSAGNRHPRRAHHQVQRSRELGRTQCSGQVYH